jgi:hypothetical protein
MKTKMIATLAGLAMLAPGAAWADEPWEYLTIDEDASPLYVATQVDPLTGISLVVDCFYDLYEYSIAVVHEDDYDAKASYAPSVTTQWVVDGELVNAPVFAFENRGQLAVSAYAYDDETTFQTLYDAIRGARERITVRYLDTVATFDAAGVAEAIASVEQACEAET